MLKITSTRFEENALIPALYTCDGENKSPALSITGVPESAKSLILIVDDPDIPEVAKSAIGADVFDHWIVCNIPPPLIGEVIEIPDGVTPPGIQGNNTRGVASYTGPCPPDREHRYFFRLFALDQMLPLTRGATRRDVEQAMQGHVLESTELIARYGRKK